MCKATAPSGLTGADIEFPVVSVGATENLLMAATLARGTTVIRNAAREPEIVDLAHCLRRMGAQIDGEGSDTIEVRGVDRLHGATHPVMADRIEVGSYMLAAAITGGEVELVGGRRDLVAAFADKLDEAGIAVTATNTGLKVSRTNGHVSAVDVSTAPFPGFPTDMQAQFMAMLTLADGVSLLGGAHLREPLHARAGTDPHGRADRGPRRHRHRHRRRAADGRAGDGDRPARASAWSSPASPPRARPTSRASTTSIAATSGSRRSCRPVAPASSGCRSTPRDRGCAFRGRRRAPASAACRFAEDVAVLSAFCCRTRWAPTSEITWSSRHLRFSLLLNRFRWEDAPKAERQGRPFERVRAVLAIDERAGPHARLA